MEKEVISKIKKLIVSNENSKAFDLLINLLQETRNRDLEDEVLMRYADFNEVKERLRKGSMHYEVAL